MTNFRLPYEEAKEVLALLQAMDEILAYNEAAELRGLRLRRKEGEWLLVVQVRRKKKDLAAFFSGHRPYEALLSFGSALEHGYIRWFDDKYPP